MTGRPLRFIEARKTLMPDSATTTSSNRVWTIPNTLCAARLVGSFGLVPLAVADQPVWMLALFLTLMATDWIDGKLAVWLDQRSSFGARLDSVADAVMYGALLLATVWLYGRVLLAEWLWIGLGLGTYVASCAAALTRFRRLPSYHTRTAKVAWLLMAVAAVALFIGWSVWPLRIAMLGVAIANLEAVAITLILPHRQTDVISLFVALRARRADSPPSPADSTK